MCITAFAWKKGLEKLVLAANRDEFFSRPTRPASFWDDGETLAGTDLKHGGSWLAINRFGRMAAITNYRDPARIKTGAPSRGSIVIDFVTGTLSPETFVSKEIADASHYNAFNLLMMNRVQLCYYSNVNGEFTVLDPGIYALSNHLLDTRWPKTLKVKMGLQSLVHLNAVDHDSLLALLNDRELAPDEELPDTGISRNLEKSLSSVFISTDDYGTRCSTMLTISKTGDTHFTEVSYDQKGEVAQRKEFNFCMRSQGAASALFPGI